MAALLVHIALLAYMGAAAAYLGWLVRPSRASAPQAASAPSHIVAAARVLLFAGLVLHVASFAVALVAARGSATASGLAGAGFGSAAWRGGQLFSLLAAATVAGYLLLDLRYRLPVAGAFVAPLTVAVMVPAHLVPSGTRAIAPALTHSIALAVHVGSAAAGTAALALAFGLSLLYLASERQLKSKHPGRLFSRLPSLELIDRLGWHLSVWGFVFLSATIATGSIASHEATGAILPFAAKQGFALLAWGLLAGLIQARLIAGWRGRRVALLVVAGFLLLVGTYAGLLGAPSRQPPQAQSALLGASEVLS